jgi:hypothetical protein
VPCPAPRSVSARAIVSVLVLLAAGSSARADEIPPLPGAAEDTAPPAKPKDDRTFRFRYEFRNRGALHYRVFETSRIVNQKADLEEVTASAGEITKHFRVISVEDDGTALLETTIDRARMAVRFDDADPTRYDTASDDVPPKQFRDVQQLVGRPLARLKVAPNGKLLSLTRLDGGTDDEKLDAADNVLVEFPDRPIRIGDTWHERFDVDVLVGRKSKHPVTLQRTFELESVVDGRATIGYRIAIITAIFDPLASVQLAPRTPSGRIVFDVESGTILSRTQSVDERVFGPYGEKSTYSVTTARNEQFLDPTAAKPEVKTAAQP